LSACIQGIPDILPEAEAAGTKRWQIAAGTEVDVMTFVAAARSKPI
jgi:hypothetical protein